MREKEAGFVRVAELACLDRHNFPGFIIDDS